MPRFERPTAGNHRRVASLPETLERGRHVDLHGGRRESWLRRAILLALLGFAAAGLAGVFGQRGEEVQVASAAASLELDAPGALRSGLMYQGRFEIHAARTIEQPTLVLDDGWFDGMTINSVEPAPVVESQRGGHMILVFDRLDAGESLTVYIEPQANPTTTGVRSQGVALNDGGTVLLRIDRSVTVFP